MAEPRKRFATAKEFREYYEALKKAGKLDEAEVLADQETFPNNEIRTRTAQFRDAMRKNLGWDLNANGTIPQDKSGKSRMFLVRRATWGEEVLEYDGKKLSDGTPLKFGSAEFVRQMQMGNLFAYKVGEPKPVQVGYQYSNIHGHARREFAFSEPLDMVKVVETLNPRPTRYPRPGVFKRLIHRFIGSAFKAEFDRYDAGEKANQEWAKKYRSLENKLDEREKERSKLSKDDANRSFEEQEKEQREQYAKEIDKQKSKLTTAKERLTWCEKGGAGKFAEAIYEPVPKILRTERTEKMEEFKGRLTDDPVYEPLLQEGNIEKIDEKTGKKETYNKVGFGTAEQFKSLTVFDKDKLDLDKIPLGKTGRSVSKSEFCTVAMLHAMDPKYALEAEKLSWQHDATIQKVMVEQIGCTEQEAKECVANNVSSMYTTDMFTTNTRKDSGMYLKCAVEPARAAAVKAFNDYRAGNPEPLARMIAGGVNRMSDQLHSSNVFGNEFSGGSLAAGNVLNLIDGDPVLKRKALEAGMKRENLLAVRGAYELALLDQKARAADVKLREAAVKGEELPEQERKAYIKDILKAQAVLQAKTLEFNKTTCEKAEKLDKLADTKGVNEMSRDPKEQAEQLPAGSVYYNSAKSMANSLKATLGPRSGTLMLLSKESGQKNLDVVAEQLIEEKELMDMDPGELANELDYAGKRDKVNIGMRAMEIRAEKHLDDVTIAEIRREAGVNQPQKTAGGPEKTANKQINNTLEQNIVNAPGT